MDLPRIGNKRRRKGIHGVIPFDRLRALDRRLLARLARTEVPLVGPLLPKLSRLANRSVLWMAVSGILYASGSNRARRAATRGLVSVAATSFLVNLPVKFVFRRRRPDVAVIPAARRLGVVPASRSFPSGHSASAFAYGTGASMELPALAAPLVPTAGLVALSRVYTGVHYPADVVVGAALGASFALSTRRFWPVQPREPSRIARPRPSEGTVLSPEGDGLAIVVNRVSGSELLPDPIEGLRRALPKASLVEVDDPSHLRQRLEETARSYDAIGIYGGDGSVNAAAEVALAYDKPLLVIPGGTLNHLARDLGVKSTTAAADALRAGRLGEVDVASIDGRMFLNAASLGAYVEIVDMRERLEDRLGKWPAMLVAIARVLRRAEPVEVEIDGRQMKVWMAFFGNCRYHPSGFSPSWRDRMDDGAIDLRYIDARPGWTRLRLALALMGGRLGRSHVYQEDVVQEVRVRSPNGTLRLARDGETFRGSRDFVVRKEPRRLKVFVPSR